MRLIASLILLLASLAADRAEASMLIHNGTIVDGSGAPAQRGSMRIEGTKIIELGTFKPRPGETVVDASDLIVAPGFIDSHAHYDEGLDGHLDAFAASSQGISTIVVGQDGQSQLPLLQYWRLRRQRPAAVNIASYTGLGSLRSAVLKDDFRRPATTAEIAAMGRLLRNDLEAGSLGLSTGLEYDPDTYAPFDEVLALARIVAEYSGRYISHLRSEDRTFWQAIEEIISIGKAANIPVQISHLKLAMKALWGQAPNLLARLEQARRDGVDITADAYPYTFWQSSLEILYPQRNFASIAEAEMVLNSVVPAEQLVFVQYDPDPRLSGASLREIAARRQQAPAVVLSAMAVEAERWSQRKKIPAATIIGHSIDVADIAAIMHWPHTNICSDGFLFDAHPRGRGAFPRVLGKLVREEKLLSLEAAVHRMSGLAAAHLGIKLRGLLRPGYFADVVLFRSSKIDDRSTVVQPLRPAVGIEQLWVNGELAFAKGVSTAARAGRVITK